MLSPTARNHYEMKKQFLNLDDPNLSSSISCRSYAKQVKSGGVKKKSKGSQKIGDILDDLVSFHSFSQAYLEILN